MKNYKINIDFWDVIYILMKVATKLNQGAGHTPQMMQSTVTKQPANSILSPKKKLGVSALHGKGFSPKSSSVHFEQGDLHETESPLKKARVDNSLASRTGANGSTNETKTFDNRQSRERMR